MRVLEIKKPGLQISMGKRKHKLRKQKEDSNGFCSESSDEGVTARGCPHVSKAVNLNSVRKALRQNPVIGECTDCKNDSTTTVGATGGSDVVVDEAVDITVWICLQCAHQGCGRDSEHKHALKHCKTPRSSSHAMVLNVTHRMIWCYDCDDQVLSPANGKLHECVEYVCKHMGVTSNSTDSPQPGLKRSGSQKSDGEEVTTQSSTAATDSKKGSKKTVETLQDLKQPKAGGSSSVCQSLTQALPKVRGLSNLGNTCFFNAVMQNMSQTYLLGSILEELNTKDMKLSGCQKASEEEDEGLVSSEEASSDDEDADYKIQLDPLNISLGETGILTKTVLHFYRDMNVASCNGTLTPSSLFNQVCKKVPRFKGFQQQDSHELLRHLLDGMKGEEIRRRQEGILKQFDLADTWKRKKVSDDTKLKIKVYGRQAKRTFIDNVFGGHFISTVLCENCRTPSQIFEPFLDISLPITEEKTVRPNSQWGARGKKERQDSGNNEDCEADSKSTNGLSKHALKKASKQAKKEAKKKKADEGISAEGKKDEESSGSREKGDDDEKTKSDEAISDADVEDNVEQPSGLQGNSAVSSSEDSTVKGSIGGPTSSDVSSSRTKVDTEQSEATSTCHSETTEGVGSQAEEVSTLADGLQSMQLQEDSGIAMELNHKADAQRCQEKQLHAKVQRAARMKAMTSLATRYHAVSQECSIMSCLNQFTAPELLTGNNKFGCVVCTRLKTKKQGDKGKKEMVLANASKQLLILQLPAVLTLHLKRFQQMGFSLRKVNRHVEFPMMLDVAPYCSALCQGIKPNQTRVLYSLYGIVEHSGRLTGGHYTAYVKVRAKNQQQQQKFLGDMSFMSIDSMVAAMRAMSTSSPVHEDEPPDEVKPPPGKWYYISDSRVNEVTHEANILRCQAYLLFYERIY